MLDAGLITQEDYDAAKAKALGSETGPSDADVHAAPRSRTRPPSTARRCPLEEELAAARAEPEPGPDIDDRQRVPGGRRQPLPQVRLDRRPAARLDRRCWCACSAATSGRRRASRRSSASARASTSSRARWSRGGAEDIAGRRRDVMTFKCGGCGAEVVVNTAHAMNARCHWCRHTLNVNQQMPNGAVPDAVLPFRLTHDEAVEKIREFASQATAVRARGGSRRSSCPRTSLGVYLPYLVIDARAECGVRRQGRGPDAALDGEERRQQGDLLRRRRLPASIARWPSPSTT